MLVFFFHVAFYGLNVTVAKYRSVAINYGFQARHLEIIKKRDALPLGRVAVGGTVVLLPAGGVRVRSAHRLDRQ